MVTPQSKPSRRGSTPPRTHAAADPRRRGHTPPRTHAPTPALALLLASPAAPLAHPRTEGQCLTQIEHRSLVISRLGSGKESGFSIWVRHTSTQRVGVR